MEKITRTVWLLSLVSLFTDIASEMLYPVMPIYLQTIGFSIFYIGLLEGVAEATASLGKGYFGRLSDAIGRRVPFVQAGYTLSALAKPLFMIAAQPLWVFFCRTLDRLGKGLRTGARDALLSAEATPESKATVFGFHRAMDTLGAAIGPALALLYLAIYPGAYRDLFLFTLLPGIMAIALIMKLHEKNGGRQADRVRVLDFFRYFWRAQHEYRSAIFGMLLFTLFNSSDVFLLLLMKVRGASDTQVIGLYIYYNLVYALASYPLGRLADRWGLKNAYLAGLLLFTFVYTGMVYAHTWTWLILLFSLYGLYAALTEGISKAWISNLCNKEDTATAIGAYTAVASIATMVASALAGLVWVKLGENAAMQMAAAGSLAAALWLIFQTKNPIARVRS